MFEVSSPPSAFYRRSCSLDTEIGTVYINDWMRTYAAYTLRTDFKVVVL